MGLYSYISTIDNTDIFTYLVLIVVLIVFVNRVSPRYETLIGVIAAVMLAYYLHDRSITLGSDFIADMNNKLKKKVLNRTKNFHTDSELLTFVDNMYEYRYYNPSTFRRFVMHIDQFLQLELDMENGADSMGELYEIADELRYKILNGYHSFIYSIPQGAATMSKFHVNRDRLQDLLNRHLDTMHKYMVYSYSKQPINIRTKFIYKNQPRPCDRHFNRNYEFF